MTSSASDMFFPGNQNPKLREDIINRLEKTNVISRQLVQVWQKIKITEQGFFADHDLKTLGIQLSTFDLESPTPTKDTRFYNPLSELPNIDWGKVQFSEWTEGYIEESRRINITFLSLSNRLTEAWLRSNDETPFAYWKYLIERPAIATGEHTPDVPYEWQTHSDVGAKSTNLSHCIFRISNYTEPEEQLSRGELIAIVTYMKWRMVQIKHIQHYLFPSW
ncbi:hypothetical protein P170DRAFT_58078 [Aspergillus steynii IBT 23096]|uniref:Uncharacterized protein n=1 Tax=Aspergillus steynii IBT 23096 TaxID=1392250 RepID=A0A2I2FSJ8_9EURO|nr:uncharacterized protein P170DRAFT_58078 [Aspergillus steynii IBT 23096]PLB43615.1 hypothetical protein P170DRAFT_58078 [Aspergillus steynii IBT 23096]